MNPWILTATVLVFCLIPCGIVCLHGAVEDRLVGLEAAGNLLVLILLLLAEGFHRIPFVDLSLALALLAFGGGLVFARFLERWM